MVWGSTYALEPCTLDVHPIMALKKEEPIEYRGFGSELELTELPKLAATIHFLQSLESSISYPSPACSAVLAQITI